jgi:hypothetical protein
MEVLAPIRRLVRPYRRLWRQEQERLGDLYGAIAPASTRNRIASQLESCPRTRTALVVGYDTPKLAAMQLPLMASLRLAGHRAIVLLPAQRGASADFYRSIGADTILAVEEIARPAPAAVLAAAIQRCGGPGELLDLKYSGISIGRFVASTVMRRRRIGSVDPRRPELREAIDRAVAASISAVESAKRIFDRFAPDIVCFYDRGYTPEGELSEVAFAAGADTVSWNAAHKSGFVVSKRQKTATKKLHFSAPSAATWRYLRDMTWQEESWQRLRDEVEGCYRSGVWYDEVGTQFNKRVVPRDEIVRTLGLDPARRTAVVFPHLFWDATFFWGDDLFADYRDWFCQVLRAAAENDRLNWVVKLHPASVVKDRRDGYSGESSEMAAMREVLGELPPHIAFLRPDSPVSTLSLYEIMDYCLTVRGTVGIEAAMYGVPVLTAGTGRYNGYGFTIDSTDRKSYLALLAKLDTIDRSTDAQTELARRYAYGLFLLRPLELRTMRFRYRQDESATLDLALELPEGRRIESMPDIACLAAWLSGVEEDLVGSA